MTANAESATVAESSTLPIEGACLVPSSAYTNDSFTVQCLARHYNGSYDARLWVKGGKWSNWHKIGEGIGWSSSSFSFNVLTDTDWTPGTYTIFLKLLDSNGKSFSSSESSINIIMNPNAGLLPEESKYYADVDSILNGDYSSRINNFDSVPSFPDVSYDPRKGFFDVVGTAYSSLPDQFLRFVPLIIILLGLGWFLKR